MNSKEENSVPSAPTDMEGASKEQEENSILSAPTKTGDASKESRNSVLSGPPLQAEQSTPTNKFSCCEITDRSDGSSTAQDQVYMDTDPEGRLAIYTDVLVRPYKTARVTSMEVKVDPGAEGSLMPVCHFRGLSHSFVTMDSQRRGYFRRQTAGLKATVETMSRY